MGHLLVVLLFQQILSTTMELVFMRIILVIRILFMLFQLQGMVFSMELNTGWSETLGDRLGMIRVSSRLLEALTILGLRATVLGQIQRILGLILQRQNWKCTIKSTNSPSRT